MSSDIVQRFERFHAENPVVYTVLTRLAQEWMARRGRGKLSVELLFLRAWWDTTMQAGYSDVKISNHFRSPYVRLTILQNPELDGVFEMLPRRRRPDAGQADRVSTPARSITRVIS
jgi:hypothetical protein